MLETDRQDIHYSNFVYCIQARSFDNKVYHVSVIRLKNLESLLVHIFMHDA